MQMLRFLPALPVLRYRLARVASLLVAVAREGAQNALAWAMTRTTDPLVRKVAPFSHPSRVVFALGGRYWSVRSWADQPAYDAMEAGWEAQAAGEDLIPPSRWGSLAEVLRGLVAPSRCGVCGGPLWFADSRCPNEAAPYGGPFVWEPAEGDDEDGAGGDTLTRAEVDRLFPPAA